MNAPPTWVCGLSLDGTAQFGAPDATARINPGQSLVGFHIASYGLPAIRTVLLEPKVNSVDTGVAPPKDDSRAEMGTYLGQVAAIQRNASVKTVTVAPTAPPANFAPGDFLATIISYKEQAIQQGWIDNSGISNSLDAKLNAARDSLSRNDTRAAKNQLNALINELDAQAGRHLTPEAVALLKFNVQYLISKLQ
jgi:hypothetical protein